MYLKKKETHSSSLLEQAPALKAHLNRFTWKPPHETQLFRTARMWMPFDGLPYGAANVNLAHTDSSPQDSSWEKSAWLQAFEHQAAHMCFFYSSSSFCLPVWLCLTFSKFGSKTCGQTVAHYDTTQGWIFFYKGPALQKTQIAPLPEVMIFLQTLAWQTCVSSAPPAIIIGRNTLWNGGRAICFSVLKAVWLLLMLAHSLSRENHFLGCFYPQNLLLLPVANF